MTPDEFRRHGHEVVEWVARYMERVAELPISPAGPAPITTTSNVRIARTLLAPGTRLRDVHSPWGRHGFDVVGSLGRLRVEVPEAS